MKATCIDVSTWNGDIDFNKVKAAGIEAVIIRAGYGHNASQKDKRFEMNYKNAKAAGLKIGAYWYSYAGGADPVEDARKEAAACLSVISGKTFDLPIYFDIEEQGSPNIPSYGKAICTKICKAFCNAIIKGGYRAGVYANLNWFNNYLDYEALHKKYSIWLAQWGNTKQLNCDIWQNSANGTVNGINGLVDTDIIVNSLVVNNSSSTEKPKKKTITELAKEVIAGKWGNSIERKERLTQAGYNYYKVQARVNELMEPRQLYYKVKKGDSLTAIASKYNTTVDKLVRLNKISNPNLIYAGQRLRVK